MHLLHERGLGVDQPPGGEHAMHLGHNDRRIEHVLQHRLDDDAVEHPILEGKAVPVGHQLDVPGGVDVGTDDVDIAGLVEGLGAGAPRAAADDQDPWTGGELAKLRDEPPAVPRADIVPAHQIPAQPLLEPGRGLDRLILCGRGGALARDDAVIEVDYGRLAADQRKPRPAVPT